MNTDEAVLLNPLGSMFIGGQGCFGFFQRTVTGGERPEVKEYSCQSGKNSTRRAKPAREPGKPKDERRKNGSRDSGSDLVGGGRDASRAALPPTAAPGAPVMNTAEGWRKLGAVFASSQC